MPQGAVPPHAPAARTTAVLAALLLTAAALLGAGPASALPAPATPAVPSAPAAPAAPDGDALQVTLPGTIDTALGCAGDWQVDCAEATMTRDADSGMYTLDADLPAGSYTYKVAEGGSWDVNYGAGGVPGGDDVPLEHEGGAITFWYDPTTHVVATTSDGPLITLPGSIDAALGCPGDWAPDCMATWMQDPDGDGVYTFTTSALPAGSYTVKVAHDRSWDENYGADGAPGGADIPFSTQDGKIVSFSYDLSTHRLTVEAEDPLVAGAGTLRAHLVDADTIAWPTSLEGEDGDDSTYTLYTAAEGGIGVEDGKVTGGTALGTLTPRGAPLTAAELEGRGHLAGFRALDLTGVSREELAAALRGQIAVARTDADGVEALTGVQIPGGLDALYADAAAETTLGPVISADGASLSLWAPTARTVTLQLLDPLTPEQLADPATVREAAFTEVPLERDDATGVWSVHGPADWEDRAYRFAVEVYEPTLGRMVTSVVTDPSSVGLTLDSAASMLVDLSDERWAPEVWTDTPAPVVEQFADQTIYELHLRDFSAGDTQLPEDVRGTYAAFGHPDSQGSARLRELADAGMTTVHVLPTFDVATIEEDRSAQKVPEIPDAGPASPEQQAAVTAVAGEDAYNWGYDPFHYSVPEGSYARTGHQVGGERTAEFRSMVGNIHAMGLQVVLDQVFNHTAASGQADTSVLDRVVPGYYQRLDLDGKVENSTCCSNTATENAMMNKLMVDSVVLWAREYHVDGFRFDLMGHHSAATMQDVRAALDELTLEHDGVDGRSIYLYGEGWNFGEVADGARFPQATQGNLGGTSIGAFNDRLRDAVHGGSPFDTDKRTHQGFGNGLVTMPNGSSPDDEDTQLADLRHRTDLVRLGLAGNLADYELLASDGTVTRGDELDYNGAPAGFATRPEESVNYVDAHDNEALYDMNVWKLPQDASSATRARMNTLSLATVTLGQSPSFWAGGTDVLRSKSLDRDSYDSGDHFNAIDWSGQDTGFGRGLPPEGKNGEAWDLMTPMLEDPAKAPTPEDVEFSEGTTLDLLRLRSSSPLFTLGDAELIEQKVSFPNAGPDATPGLLVMRIDDTVGTDADPALDGLVVVFNASGEPITETVEGMEGTKAALSPVQKKGTDAVVKTARWKKGTVTVPAQSVAVFVQKQSPGTGHGKGKGQGQDTQAAQTAQTRERPSSQRK